MNAKPFSWPAITAVSTAALLLGLVIGAALGKMTVKPIKVVERVPHAVMDDEPEPPEWIDAAVLFAAASDGHAHAYEQRWITVRGKITDIDLSRKLPTVTVAKGKVKLQFSFDSNNRDRAESARIGEVVQLRAWCAIVSEHPDGTFFDMTAARIEEWIKKVGY